MPWAKAPAGGSKGWETWGESHADYLSAQAETGYTKDAARIAGTGLAIERERTQAGEPWQRSAIGPAYRPKV